VKFQPLTDIDTVAVVPSNTTEMKPFHYSKLSPKVNEIRLLRILPGKLDGSIRAKVYKFPLLPGLKGCPRFAAISKASGPPSQRTIPIQVNDALLPVRPDVHELLLTLRSSRAEFPTQPQFVWIEDVCINKEDPNEQNGRTKLMRAVYSSAEMVLLWLGAAGGGSNEAMEYLGSLKREPGVADDHSFDDGARTHLGGEDVGTTLQGEMGDRVVALLSRDSWNRVGIVNEVLLSRKLVVLCGTKRIAWSRLDSLFAAVECYLSRSFAGGGRWRSHVVAAQAYRLVLARDYVKSTADGQLRNTRLWDFIFSTGAGSEISEGWSALEVYDDLAAYFMARILDELKVLTEQSSTVRLGVCDSTGCSVDSADAEIARFKGILQRIYILEMDFDRIAQIRDMVRSLRKRAEDLEEGLDVGAAQ
jgi:hypothetical protein